MINVYVSSLTNMCKNDGNVNIYISVSCNNLLNPLRIASRTE